MAEPAANGHRELLQEIINSLGRDDIGVGEVVESGGKLHFTLTRGEYHHRDEIALNVLADREQARSAVMAIIPRLSKLVEREHIEAAQQPD